MSDVVALAGFVFQFITTTGIVKEINISSRYAHIYIEEETTHYITTFNLWDPETFIDPLNRSSCIIKLSLLRDALIHKYPVQITTHITGNTITSVAISEDFSHR
jgi:hypothetical protein